MRNLALFYQLFVYESDGLLVMDTNIIPAHSFTKQFAQLMFNVGFWCSAFSPTSMTTTGGASITTGAGMDTAFRTDAGITESTYGIQVGTGTTAESISDTALGTQVAHGTSAGQLQYGAMTYGAPSTTATTTTFRFTRVFTNGSGGTITVQEIGLVGRDTTTTANRFLFARDLTGAVAVTNGQQLTVNYDFTTTI